MYSRSLFGRVKRFHPSGRVVGTVLALTLIQACGGGGGAPAPEAGSMRGFVPDLRGRRVMVYPLQIRQGVSGDVDAEIAFSFRDRGGEIDWVFPTELRRALDRAPAIRSTVDGLTASVFLGAEVDRIGDPLYGQIRRLAELVNSDIAIIPVTMRSGAEGVEGVSVVEIVSAIVDVRTGRVMWTGVVAGRPGKVADFGTVASAVEKLTGTLLWYVR